MDTTSTRRPGLTRRTARRTLARLAATGAAALLAGGGALAAAVPVSAAPAAPAAPADCNDLGYGSAPDTLGLDLGTSEQKMADAINPHRAQDGLPALTLSRPWHARRCG